MNIELRPIDDTTREDCIKLKVSETQSCYIDTNEKSLEAAAENADVRDLLLYMQMAGR